MRLCLNIIIAYLDLYGTCTNVYNHERERIFKHKLDQKVQSVEECLAGCRSKDFNYAGIEKKTNCYCGEEPEEGFDSLFTSPDRCKKRCSGKKSRWQRCGGQRTMSLWRVPSNPDISDLNGLCVYDYPRFKQRSTMPPSERVCNKASITNKFMNVKFCKEFCFVKGFGLKLKSNYSIQSC